MKQIVGDSRFSDLTQEETAQFPAQVLPGRFEQLVGFHFAAFNQEDGAQTKRTQKITSNCNASKPLAQADRARRAKTLKLRGLADGFGCGIPLRHFVPELPEELRRCRGENEQTLNPALPGARLKLTNQQLAQTLTSVGRSNSKRTQQPVPAKRFQANHSKKLLFALSGFWIADQGAKSQYEEIDEMLGF